MLSDIKTYKIPSNEGSKGITIKQKVRSSTIQPFLQLFMPEIREDYNTNTTNRQYPFTAGDYVQYVWKIKSLEELEENLLNTFKDLKIATETLWIHHFFQKNNFLKFENPRKDENISFFFQDSPSAVEKLKKFNQKNFQSNKCRSKQTKLVVGRVPGGKKRSCNFIITFTENWKINDSFVGGILQFRFFFEVVDSGILKGESAYGDESEEIDSIEENDETTLNRLIK